MAGLSYHSTYISYVFAHTCENVCHLCSAGILQSTGQRCTTEATCDREGTVLQLPSREEDQGSGGRLCANCINFTECCT